MTERKLKNNSTQEDVAAESSPDTSDSPKMAAILPEKPETTFSILKELIAMSVPTLVTYLVSMACQSTYFYIVRHIDTQHSGAVSLGNAIAGILAFGPIGSFLSGLEVIMPQAFGRHEYSLCGSYMHRGIVYAGLLSIPLYFLLGLSPAILRFTGVKEGMADLAGKYVLTLIPSNIVGNLAAVYSLFLGGQKIVFPGMWINCVVPLLHPIWMYIFVVSLGLGHYGLAAAGTISAAISATCYWGYIRHSQQVQKCLVPWSQKEVFKGWQTFVTVCSQSAIMNCLSGWAYSIMCIFAGRLSEEELAAHDIMLNLLAWLYMFSLAIGGPIVTLMGNKLGENKIRSAKIYGKLATQLDLILSLAVEFGIIYARDSVAEYYTANPRVQELIKQMLPLIVLANFFDIWQTMAIRILCAMGKQKDVTFVLLISNWLVRIPLAVLFTSVMKMGLYGLWLTYPISYCVTSVGVGLMLWRVDWNQLGQEIAERINKEKEAVFEKGKAD